MTGATTDVTKPGHGNILPQADRSAVTGSASTQGFLAAAAPLADGSSPAAAPLADGSSLAAAPLADGSSPADDSLAEGSLPNKRSRREVVRSAIMNDLDESSGAGITELNEDQSTRMIGSLADTAKNLTQELIAKDQEIMSLEVRIEALQKDRNTGSANKISRLPAVEPLKVQTSPIPAAPRRSYLWWLIPLALLFALIYGLRGRIKRFLRKRKLFSSERAVDFEVSLSEKYSAGSNEYVNDIDYSILSAVRKPLPEGEIDGITLLGVGG